MIMKKNLRFHHYLLVLFNLGVLSFSTATAQNHYDGLSAKVDSLFARWDKPNSPGASVAVIKSGQIIHSKGYGVANLEYDVAITPETIFHVASVSKQFAAFGNVLLAQQGKLSLDDDVRKHLPETPDFGEKITIRHLIHHTSGIRDQWNLLGLGGWRIDDVITKEHIFKLLAKQRELNFSPGAEYVYCNTGYTMLGEIIARTTGKPFRDWMDEQVFAPLGMTNTLFYDDHERIVKNRAYSYSPAYPGVYRKSVLSYANAGATSLFTTAEDLARWLDNFRTTKIGGKEALEQMLERGVLTNGDTTNYAFGLVVDNYRGLRRISHGGGDAGYRTFVAYFPEHELGVVTLSNFASFNPGGLSMQAANLYLSEHLDAPQPSASPTEAKPELEQTELPVEKLKRLVGNYLLVELNTYRRIRLQDNQLFYDREGQGSSPLTPLKDGRFLMLGVPNEFILTELPSQTNEPKRLRWIIDGQPSSHLQAYEPWEPSAQEIADFAGRYYSPELETAYTIVADGGNFVAKHRRHEDISLKPRLKDHFSSHTWYFGSLRLERNSQNVVTGFRVSSGRVRNVLFEKQ